MIFFYPGRRPLSRRRKRGTCSGLHLQEYDQSADGAPPGATAHPSVDEYKWKSLLAGFIGSIQEKVFSFKLRSLFLKRAHMTNQWFINSSMDYKKGGQGVT